MTQPRTGVLGAFLWAASMLPAPAAAAGTIESTYTPLDLDTCETAAAPEAPEDGAVFRCEGLHGMDVRVAEGDLRMFVSYGPSAERQTVANQTIPVFNTIGKTLEWRLDDGAPFATILRYRWDSDNGEGSTLVVTKIGATDACHVAYVQATENATANALAREIADGQARGFSCGRDKPRTYGADGKQID